MREGRTFVAMNTHGSPTAAFVATRTGSSPRPAARPRWRAPSAAAHSALFDAEQAAMQLLGDSIYTNPLMLGYAWQKGRVPLTHAALMRAIELNGVQVDNNKAAFEWGRRCAHDLAAVQALFQAAQVIEFVKKPSVDELVARRVEFLTGYQDAAYAQSYKAFVDKVRAAEAPLNAGTALSEAVARYLFKLMAYKDEYEVARLHTDPAFTAEDRCACSRATTGSCTTSRRRASPRSNDKGELVKQPFGPWMRSAFGVLARLKGLRGGALDIFGKTEERQHGARADRRIPRLHRRTAADAERRQRGAGGRDRAHPGGDPRLRPREGAAPGGRARRSGTADGAVARGPQLSLRRR